MFKAVLVDDEILVLNLLDKIIGDNLDIKIMDKYAVHAFKLNAIHYILKPVDTPIISPS